MFSEDDDSEVYETGMFALKLDDLGFVAYDPAEEPLPNPLTAEAVIAQSERRTDPPLEMPTAARAVCGYDVFGQVLVHFTYMVPEGYGSPYYGFSSDLYLHHDRFSHTIHLILNEPGNEISVLHEWNDAGFMELAYTWEAEPAPRFDDTEAAFAAIMAHVSDAVHILPLTPLLVAQLNTVGLLPEDDLDRRIKEHGLHEIPDPSQPWKGQIVHAPRPLQVVETEA